MPLFKKEEQEAFAEIRGAKSYRADFSKAVVDRVIETLDNARIERVIIALDALLPGVDQHKEPEVIMPFKKGTSEQPKEEVDANAQVQDILIAFGECESAKEAETRAMEFRGLAEQFAEAVHELHEYRREQLSGVKSGYHTATSMTDIALLPELLSNMQDMLEMAK